MQGKDGMNITIVGAGSIGLLYAVYCAEAGMKVTLITRTKKQADLINKSGVEFIRQDDHLLVDHIDAYEITTVAEHFTDLVIFAVKSYQLPDVLPLIKEKIKSSSWLFLQNGLAHVEMLEGINQVEIGLAVIEHGAKKEGATSVQHTGKGTTRWAYYKKQDEMSVLGSFFESFKNKQFPNEYAEEWLPMLHLKLLVNGVINPLTTIFQVKNGELLKNPYIREIMNPLIEELTEVLSVPRDKGIKKVLEVCTFTQNNTSSMLTDRLSGRRMEIEAILGYAVRLAKQNRRSTPYLTYTYMAVKGIENETGRREV